MASVAPDEDWQPPPHEPEIGDIESYQAFAKALNAPPKKLIPIGERDRRWYNKKSHILLEADPEALVTLVDYVYTARVEVNEDNVQTLLQAANLLQLVDVTDACCQFLQSQLHPSNCLGIRHDIDIDSDMMTFQYIVQSGAAVSDLIM